MKLHATMKTGSLFIFVLIAFLALNMPAKANHIFGGELLYKHDTGNNYKIILTLYGDCSSSNFNLLYGSTPSVLVINGAGTSSFTAILQPDSGSNVEVSPVCPSQAGHTSCDTPAGTLPGIKRFIFSKMVTLPGLDSNWQFIFSGGMGNSSAGRSINITNVINASSSYVYLVATLNNLLAPNSSPVYSTVPTPFYCVNLAEQYNQGAIDPDNDSLTFSLVNAIDGATSTPVTYSSPFSGTNPLSVVPGDFSFSPHNGQMNFTPDMTQDALIVNQVSEYRNGILVGSSMREMTFIVLNNCTGTPPSGNINPSSVNGGTIKVQNGTTVNICSGTSSLSFDINASSTSGDTVNVIVNNAISNSSANVTNNNANNLIIHFYWQPGISPVGIYTFYVTLTDNHCPVADVQTIAFTINIVDPFSLIDSQISATQCVHQAAMHYHLYGGVLPRILTISQGGNIVKTLTDTSGFIADSLAAGTYVLSVSSPYLNCPAMDTLTIVDSGQLAFPGIIYSSYCKNALVDSVNYPKLDGASLRWYDLAGNPLSQTPVVNTDAPAVFTWYVSQIYKSCQSAIDTLQATVHDLPQISFPDMPQSVCIGDSVYLRASGGIDYTWGPANEIFIGANSDPVTWVLAPKTFQVTVTNEYGCVDSSSFTISDVEPCCQFSYPNAFTPNGDNKNDRFHPIIYGHTQNYEFSIFDRWGELVFHTFNQYASWDGTFAGVPGEIGSYFYFVRAKCLSGKNQYYKGEVTLIR